MLFETSVFVIKELSGRRNKNRRTGINKQKQLRKGILNIE